MKTFAIYEKSEQDRVAVKVGFCWPGLIWSWMWLLFARLWEQVGIVLGCFAVLCFTAIVFALNREVEMAQFILSVTPAVIGFVVGTRGNKWRRINLRARGFEIAAAVIAESKDEAMVTVRGMKINAKNNNGKASLRLAVLGWASDMIPELIARGADINAKDGKGRTPLHDAATLKPTILRDLMGQKFRPIVKTLIDHGADVNARDASGQTPLDIAIQMNDDPDVKKFIIGQGGMKGENM